MPLTVQITEISVLVSLEFRVVGRDQSSIEHNGSVEKQRHGRKSKLSTSRPGLHSTRAVFAKMSPILLIHVGEGIWMKALGE